MVAFWWYQGSSSHMTVYALDHYHLTCANALTTAACIWHHPSLSSESHRDPRLCPSRWSSRQPTHRSPGPVMVWSSRSTVYGRGEPGSGFRQWSRIRYALHWLLHRPILIVPFMRYRHLVWCWGWDGAGDLDGPDVDPIWERMPGKSMNSSAVSIRHNRMWL